MEKYYMHNEILMEEKENGEVRMVCQVCGKEIDAPVSKIPCIDPEKYLPVVNGLGLLIEVANGEAHLMAIDVRDGLLGFKFNFYTFSPDSDREFALGLERIAQLYATEWFGGEIPREEKRYLIPPDEIVELFEENYGKKFRVIPVEEEIGQ